MTRPPVHIEIDEIVLEGFDEADPGEINSFLEPELARVIGSWSGVAASIGRAVHERLSR